MTATVTSIATHPAYRPEDEKLVPRRELSPIIGYGKTKVFQFIREGMPVAETTTAGHRFKASACKAWLRANGYVVEPVSVGSGYAITPDQGATDA